MEIVRAALGDEIDRGAREAAVADIGGAGDRIELLDRVERDRIEERRQTGGVEAELVVDAIAVDHDRIVAVVLTEGRDLGFFAVTGQRAKRDGGRAASETGFSVL